MQLQVTEVNNKYDEIKKSTELFTEEFKEFKLEYKMRIAQSKYDEASDIMREIGRMEENTNCNKGESEKLLKQTRSFNEVKKLLFEAIELNPNFDKAYDKLARIFKKEKNLNKAIEYELKAIEINEQESYFSGLAEYYYHNFEYDNAIKYAKKSLEKQEYSRKKAFLETFIAYIYSLKNNERETIKYATQAIQKMPENPTVLSSCGCSYVNIKKFKQGIDLILKAKKQRIKEYPTDFYNLTEAYIFDKKYDKALETLKKYIEIQNKNICYGITINDYYKWSEELNSPEIEQTKTIEELKNLIEQLEKKDKEDEI